MQPLFSRLRRITNGAHWIPELDGLRFLAIFMVVAYHVDQQLLLKADQALTQHGCVPVLRLIGNGSRGVEIFFVISGFLLGLPFARHALLAGVPVSIGRYYLRRLTRLEPPYLFNLVVLSIAILIYQHAAVRDLLQHFVASALYIHEAVYGRVSTINGVTWTLEIELQFYLLLPLLALALRVRAASIRRMGFVAFIAAFVALNQYSISKDFFGHPEAWIFGSVFFYLQYFLVGMLLSDMYLTVLPGWKPHAAWDVAGLCCWTIYFYADALYDGVLLPVLLFLCFLGALRGTLTSRFLRLGPIAVIGGMSYSIYLWHFFIISLFFRITKHLLLGRDAFTNLVVQCLLLMPLILFFSSVFFRFTERPFMDSGWPQKAFAKIKAAAVRPQRL